MVGSSYDYEYLVVGAGNGGLASAKRAASYGAKVAIVEAKDFGGTGLNNGTIPKKIMYHCGSVASVINNDAARFGIDAKIEGIRWDTFKKNRNDFIKQLQDTEQKEIKEAGISIIHGKASFVNPHTIAIKSNDTSVTTVTAEKILISTGSKSVLPSSNGVRNNCISSDDYFQMKNLPKKVVIAVESEGYIGIEMSYVLHALGCETHFVIKGPTSMKYCDEEANTIVDKEMERNGVKYHCNSGGIASVTAKDELKTVTLGNGEVIGDVNTVIFTPIRTPNVEGLGLEKAGITQRGDKKYISVNEYHCTSVPHIFAVGDVTTEVHQLTPKTVAAARSVTDILFGGLETSKVTFEDTPYAFFSYPSIANVGLSEKVAIEKYGVDSVKVYRSYPKQGHLYHSLRSTESDTPKSFIKMVCSGANEKVVGLHIVGSGAEEVLQGFAVAMKMGATKSDFDSCLAIEPTLAGEVVQMGNWGSAPQHTGAKVSPQL